MLRWLVIAAFAGCFVLGCSPPCATSESDAVFYDGGTHPNGIYETSPIDGQYLHFPGGRRFSLHHGLGTTPQLISAYVAFEEYPLKENNIATAAGNQVVIEVVDNERVQVHNDTCDDLYLRVVASGGGASDASAD